MSIKEKYKLLCEGKYSVSQFKRDAVMTLPQFITVNNSLEDITKILKNKGIITELVDIKKEAELVFDADRVNPYELKKGIRMELKVEEQYATEDEYFKAKQTAVKNIQKDPTFYTNKIAGVKNVAPEKRTDIMKLVKDKMVDDKNGMQKVKINKPKDEKSKKSEVVIKESLHYILNKVA